MSKFVAVLLLAVCVLSVAQAARNEDRIRSLPGVDPAILGTQYSGYYQVDATNGRNLHYWFAQAQHPTEHVVLWLNGGPGCSSLDGFLYENGPFSWGHGPNNVTLVRNEHSWNRVAHMIYLESPAGVGFSYSNTPSDYLTANDTRTANDAFIFLTKWFQDFPEYKSYKFYIAGESYAGIYVPTLANRVVAGNQAGESNINLVGIAVGNGVTDPVADSNLNNLFPFAYGHALYPTQLNDQIQKTCPTAPNGIECQKLSNQVYNIFNLNLLNIYDIYGNCYHQRPLTVSTPILGQKNTFKLFKPQSEVPCINSRKAEVWLNTRAVQEAIHVKEGIKWEICSTVINENYHHDILSMLPIYTNLFNNGVRVLIYSGDTDASVPFTGTQYWTSRLGGNALSLWQPWFTQNHQIAGFETIYPNDFRFVTVRGAGHMVPQFRPVEAFMMFDKWLRGETLALSASHLNVLQA